MPPPKYKISKNLLSNFSETLESVPDITENEAFTKFPELKNDTDLLNLMTVYHNTSKSGKYKTEAELNSKFPEFEFSTKAKPWFMPMEEVTQVQPAAPAKSPQFNMIEDVKEKKARHDAIAAMDYKTLEEAVNAKHENPNWITGQIDGLFGSVTRENKILKTAQNVMTGRAKMEDLGYLKTAAPVIYSQVKQISGIKGDTPAELQKMLDGNKLQNENEMVDAYADHLKSGFASIFSKPMTAEDFFNDNAAPAPSDEETAQKLMQLTDDNFVQKKIAEYDKQAKDAAIKLRKSRDAEMMFRDDLNPFNSITDDAAISQENEIKAQIQQKKLVLAQGMVYAKIMSGQLKNENPIELGMQILKIVDPDKYAQLRHVKPGNSSYYEVEAMALPVMLAAGETPEERKVHLKAIEGLDKKYPYYKKVDEVKARLEAELFKSQNIVWNRTDLKKADEAAKQLSVDDKEYYNKYLRPEIGLNEAMVGMPYQEWRLLINPAVNDRGILKSFVSGLTQPLEGIADFAINFNKTSDERINEQLNRPYKTNWRSDKGQFAPAIARLNQLDEKAKGGTPLTADELNEKDDIKTYTNYVGGVENFANKSVDMLGNVVAYGFLTRALAVVASPVLKAVAGAGNAMGVGAFELGNAIAGGGLTNTATKFAITKSLENNVGGLIAGYISSVDGHRNEASLLFPDSPTKQKVFGEFMALGEAFSERIFKDEKIFNAFQGKFKVNLATALKAVSKDGLNDLAAQTLVKQAFRDAVRFVGITAGEATKESVEEAAVEFEDVVLKMTMGPKSVDLKKEIAEVGTVFADTFIHMGIPASMAGYKGFKENRVSVPLIAQIGRPGSADFTNSLISGIRKAQREGTLSPNAAMEKIAVIQSLKNANIAAATMLHYGMGEGKVTTRQFDKYVVTLANENLMQDRADKTQDPVLKKSLEKQIAESQKIREAIIEGSVYVDEDYAVQTPEEAAAQQAASNAQAQAAATATVAAIAADPTVPALTVDAFTAAVNNAPADAVTPGTPVVVDPAAAAPVTPDFSVVEKNGFFTVVDKKGKVVSVHLTRAEAEKALPKEKPAPTAPSGESASNTNYAEMRKAGKVVIDGIQYERPAEMEFPVLGKTQKTKFSQTVTPETQFAVVEADDITASHTQTGKRNPLHFIPDGQPNERSDAASVAARGSIASAPVFDEITQGVGAFTGAPVINARGEVIQGNNRTMGLKDHYAQNGQSYKDELVKRAGEFGVDADKVAGMRKPVLVRLAAVSDAKAIEFGNYKSGDLETGGTQRIDPIATSRKMPMADKLAVLRNLITDAEVTLKENIRANWAKVQKLMAPKFISPTQLNTMLDAEGNLKPQGVDDIFELIKHFLFENGDVRLPAVFEGVPHTISQGVYKSMPAIFGVPAANSMLPEIQNAMVLLYNVQQSGADNVAGYLAQDDMFDADKNSKYSAADIAIATALENIYNNNSEVTDPATGKRLGKEMQIRRLFSQYEAASNGVVDIFQNTPGVDKATAMQQVFGVPAEEDNVVQLLQNIQNDIADENSNGQGAGENQSPNEAGTPGESPAGDQSAENAEPEVSGETPTGIGQPDGDAAEGGSEANTYEPGQTVNFEGAPHQIESKVKIGNEWKYSIKSADGKAFYTNAEALDKYNATESENDDADYIEHPADFLYNKLKGAGEIGETLQQLMDVYALQMEAYANGDLDATDQDSWKDNWLKSAMRMNVAKELMKDENNEEEKQVTPKPKAGQGSKNSNGKNSKTDKQETDVRKLSPNEAKIVEDFKAALAAAGDATRDVMGLLRFTVPGGVHLATVVSGYNPNQKKASASDIANSLEQVRLSTEAINNFLANEKKPPAPPSSPDPLGDMMDDLFDEMNLMAEPEATNTEVTEIAPDSPRAKAIVDNITKLFKRVAGFKGVQILSAKDFAAAVDEAGGKGTFTKANGQVYGMEHKGVIYLNAAMMNANTPVHEAAHVFLKWAKLKNQVLFKAGLEIARKSPYYAQVKANPVYANASENVQAEEALAWMVGAMGNDMQPGVQKNAVVKLWDKLITKVTEAIHGYKIDTPAQMLAYMNGFRLKKGIAVENLDEGGLAKMNWLEFGYAFADRILSGKSLAKADIQTYGEPDFMAGTQKGELIVTEKTKPILDEVTDEKIGEEKYQDFAIEFNDGASSFGNIKKGIASIVGIKAATQNNTAIRGTKTYERVLNKLQGIGVTSVNVRLQSSDSSKAIDKLLAKGVLSNPRNITGSSGNERPTTFDITGSANFMADGLTDKQKEMAVKLVDMFIQTKVYSFEDMIAKTIERMGEKAAVLFPAMQTGYSEYFNKESSDSIAEKMDAVIRGVKFENIAAKQLPQQKSTDNVPNRPGNSQQDSGNAADGITPNAKNVQGNGGRSGGNGGRSSSKGRSQNRKSNGGQGVLDLFAPAIGTQGNIGVQGSEPGPGISSTGTGGTDGRGNSTTGTTGSSSNNSAGSQAVDQPIQPSTGSFAEQVARKLIEQRNAEPIEVIPMDEANIRATLPFLLPEQQDDVLKAEKRFFGDEHKKPELANGKGMLFTNGTGTGKTYTGLGIIKRFVKQGKGNVLIVVPSQNKVSDWVTDGRNLGLEISELPDTSTGGTGIVVTTYANFRANDELMKRDFDLVVYDESHRLLENKNGEASGTSYQHYEASNKDAHSALSRITTRDPLWIEVKELKDRYKSLSSLMNHFDTGQNQAEVLGKQMAEIEKQLETLEAEQERRLPGLKERAQRAVENTKVVFLSATPFKAHFNLRYVNGYLFDWGNETIANARGSRVDPESRFYLENFGSAYRWRNHRLEPQSPMNKEAVAMQEMAFSENLMKAGSLSGRVIESNKDYSREFPLVAGFNHTSFNKAFSDIYNYETKEFEHLRDEAQKIFYDHNYTTQLFESLKTAMYIPRMQQHLDLGRKIVVFHRRKQANATPPFETILSRTKINAAAVQMNPESTGEDKVKATEAIAQIEAFRDKYKELLQYESTLNYNSAIEQIGTAFGNIVTYLNGDVSSKPKKLKAVRDFNDDASPIKILVVQEDSGKEGISLHDVSGQSQRVLTTLSMPNSSTTALQIEGRIYRIGQESDAIFEYPLLGLDLEVAYFGQNINKRLSTTENLAVGNASRDLIRSFAEGVLFNSNTDKPSAEQGKGGKEYDKREASATSDFQKAKLVYATNQKVRGRRDQREGVDYFATPEPLGQKMVEWAGLKPGERMMEPSAGHGAIAMWAPTHSELTAVEPSFELYSKLAGRAGGGQKRILNQRFEDLAVMNKYEAIVMNPPFGVGGKLAMDHVEKAFKHLANGGRLVAIVPVGAMDKRVDEFLYGTDEKGRGLHPDAHLRAEIKLPSITFTQAGTSVSTRVLIIDKVAAVDGFMEQKKNSVFADNISEFFDAIEFMDVPARAKVAKAEQTPLADLTGPRDAKISAASDKLLAGPTPYTNTKTGAQMHEVKMTRYAGDEYAGLNARAKANNGFYSRFTKSFLFEKVTDAQKFVDSEDGPNFMAMPDGRKVQAVTVMPEVVDGFYSPLEKSLLEAKQDRLPVKQWLDRLNGDEAKWTGVREWLGNSVGTIDKADILDFLKKNRVEIREVVKGEPFVKKSDFSAVFNKEENLYEAYFNGRPTGIVAETEAEAIEEGFNEADPAYMDSPKEGDRVKYSSYQLEGEKSNYKEVLVTMPSIGIEKPYKQWLNENWTGDDTESARKLYKSQLKEGANFKSTHFDEPNILVHLRMNTRTDSEGKKVLFIEELQSDWAQKGRKEGFVKTLEAQKVDDDSWMVDAGDKNGWSNKVRIDYYADVNKFVSKTGSFETLDLAVKSANDYLSNNVGIAAAPFVTNTADWVKLGLKVALKQAVAQGADKIAWATGEQENDRYSLEKQVDKVILFPDRTLRAYKNGSEVLSISKATDKQIEDNIGKEIAQRLLTSPVVHEAPNENQEAEPHQKLEGDNLKVGGKGMKAFYGSPAENNTGIVGQVAAKLFGQDIKTTEISQDRKPNNEFAGNAVRDELLGTVNSSTQHSITITPELIARVEGGQPMFMAKAYKAETPEQKALKAQLDVAEKDYAAAKGAYDRKRAELMKGYKESIVDLFGQTKEQRGPQQKMFEEKPVLSAAEKALAPFKMRMDKAGTEANRLYKEFMGIEGQDSQQMAMFMAGVPLANVHYDKIWKQYDVPGYGKYTYADIDMPGGKLYALPVKIKNGKWIEISQEHFNAALRYYNHFGPFYDVVSDNVIANSKKEAKAKLESFEMDQPLMFMAGKPTTGKNQLDLFSQTPVQHETKIEGKTVQYESQHPADYGTSASDIQREGDKRAKAKPGELKTIEAVWRETKHIDFTGSSRVSNAGDVAHIMRLLEDKSVEHAFAVHLDASGNSHVQMVSLGGTTGTVIDPMTILQGAERFKSVKTWLVHNHPSGNLTPSIADIELTKKIRRLMANTGVEIEHVIMDTYKHEYTLIDKYDNVENWHKRDTERSAGDNLKLHVLDGFKALTEPSKSVNSSRTIADFLYGLKFSQLPKRGILLLNQGMAPIGNVFLKGTFNDTTDIIKTIASFPTTKNVIFYGNQSFDRLAAPLRALKETMKDADVRALDYINIKGESTYRDSAYEYDSASDEGLFYETQEKYGTNRLSSESPNFMAAPAAPSTNQYFNGVVNLLKTGTPVNQILPMLSMQVGPQMAQNIIANAQRRVAAMPNNSVLNFTPDQIRQADRSMADKIAHAWRKNFTSSEGVPSYFKELSEYAKGESQWIIRKADHFMNGTLKPEFKKMNADQKEGFMDLIGDLAAATAAVQSLLPGQIAIAQEFRRFVDDLSTEFVVNGWVSPNLAMTLMENMGNYLNRSYRIFNEADYKVPEAAMNQGAIFFRDQGIAMGKSIAEAEVYAEHELKAYIAAAKSEYKGIKTLVESGRDNGIFITRDNVPEPLRRVLGEYADPGEIFMMTVARMAATRSQAKYLQGVFDMGIGKIFWREDDLNRDPLADTKIAGDSNQGWNPLNGLMTTKEIADYMHQAVSHDNSVFVKAIQKGIGFVKMGKTVWSPVTQAKNVFGNIGWHLLNGYWLSNPVTKAIDTKNAFKFWYQNLLRKDGALDLWNEKLVKLGIFDSHIGTAEIKRMFASGDVEQIMNDARLATMAGWVGKAKRLANDNWITRNYQLADVCSKFVAFQAETSALAWALHNTDYDKLTPEQVADIDKQAAERVKNTQPTSQRAYKGALWVSDHSKKLLGNFLTYRAESVRCFLNVFRYAIKDMKSDNPRMKILGARRAAGIVSYMAARTAVNYYLIQGVGLAMSGLMSAFDDDDEEKKKKLQALNMLGPEWMRSSEKYAIKHEDGTWEVTLINALEPFDMPFKIMNAYTNGSQNVEDPGVLAAIDEVFDPFIESSILLQAVKQNLIKGEDAYGNKHAESSDEWIGLGKDLLPGWVSFAQRTQKRTDGTTASWDEIFNHQDDLHTDINSLELTGLRSYKVNPKLSFRSKIHDELAKDHLLKTKLDDATYDLGKKRINQAEFDKIKADVTAGQIAIGKRLNDLSKAVVTLQLTQAQADEMISKLREIVVLSKPTKKEALKD